MSDEFKELQTFFERPAPYKKRFFQEKIGYRDLNTKELFEYRGQTYPEEIKQCQTLPAIFDQIVRDCLTNIAEKMDWSKAVLLDLLDQQTTHSAQVSCSVLRLFHYQQSSDNTKVGAEEHTDIGLLTLIPKSTAPALEVYDYESSCWRNIEMDLQSDECIVLVGELLAKICNQHWIATPHRVATLSQDRYSIVYQARGRMEAQLDSAKFENDRTGRFQQPFSLSVQKFVFQEQARVQSVNGAYL